MATKRKTAKKKSTGKRKVGAVKKEQSDLLYMFAGTALGAVGTRFATNAFKKQTAVVVDDKIISAVQVAAGALLAWFGDHPIIKGLGVGMATEGVIGGLISLEVLNGSDLASGGGGLMVYRPNPNLSGTTVTPAVAGTNIYGFPQASVGNTPSKYAGVYN